MLADLPAARPSIALYKSLLEHRSLLSRLSTRRSTLENELTELRKIMDDLVRSYNPNYQDMSVRAAARGYMELYYGGRVAPAEGGEGSEEPLVDKPREDAAADDVKPEELSAVLERTDVDGLLVGWEDGTEGGSNVDDLEAIRPSSLYSWPCFARSLKLTSSSSSLGLQFSTSTTTSPTR
jgi:hypothetical protein